ncbi:diphthamide biosynthesis protein 3 [Stylonychia lemnae]|uniref:Diphthamide biosynthesis protein 3 n=1 Tax=Stylonychia lemnae TaxID=5949 RepID=A0A078AQA9_STYLE|nr:diphthamide biosynthesis protein 3 [Stylonychia lemnae]|eukprot:CDW84349.1 diphthamide biosynthesis protein 3 [Stylonychia lemnae]
MADNEDVQNIYDEIEIDDMDFEEDQGKFFYPCPCGDKFQITIKEIIGGLDIATCPSCSLQIKIIYDDDYLKDFIKERGLEQMVEAY